MGKPFVSILCIIYNIHTSIYRIFVLQSFSSHLIRTIRSKENKWNKKNKNSSSSGSSGSHTVLARHSERGTIASKWYTWKSYGIYYYMKHNLSQLTYLYFFTIKIQYGYTHIFMCGRCNCFLPCHHYSGRENIHINKYNIRKAKKKW